MDYEYPLINNVYLNKIIEDISVIALLNYSSPSTLDNSYNFNNYYIKDYIEGLFYLCINGKTPGDIARSKYFLTKISQEQSYYKDYALAILGFLYITDAQFYTDQNNIQIATKLKSVAEDYLVQAAGNTIHKDIDPEISFLIGTAYQLIEKDLYAIPWYQMALRSNNIRASGRLSLIYSLGKDVPVDYKRAYTLAQYGAQNNNPLSYYVLGVLYENGLGVSNDIGKAISYYKKGCTLGNNLSCQSYKKINGDSIYK